MFYSLLSSYVGTAPFGEEDVYLYEEVWQEYAQSFLTKVFLYFAIAAVAVLFVVGVFVKLKREESFAAYLKGCLIAALAFAATVIVTMFALEFGKTYEKDYFSWATGMRDMVFIPTIVTGAVAVLGIAACYIAGLYGKKAQKIATIATACAIAAAVVALLVCLGVYYGSGDAEVNNGAEISGQENIALYLSAVGLVAVIAVLALLFGKGETLNFNSKAIAYGAICIAMSFALSYIKFFEMPQGGSLTLASLLPLMLFSYMFGVRKGVIAALIYGFMQAMQGLWLIHPAQFLLDYPIAFTAIGLAGMFAKVKKLEKLPQLKFALGAVTASVIRFASHVLAGVFAFSEYSTLDNVWVYSLGYNAFVFPDIAIAIAVGIILFSSKAFNRQVEQVQAAAAPRKADKPADAQGENK